MYFEDEMEMDVTESYAEKVKANYAKKREGKHKDALKREKKLHKSGKHYSRMRVRDYDYDNFNNADLKRYFG